MFGFGFLPLALGFGLGATIARPRYYPSSYPYPYPYAPYSYGGWYQYKIHLVRCSVVFEVCQDFDGVIWIFMVFHPVFYYTTGGTSTGGTAFWTTSANCCVKPWLKIISPIPDSLSFRILNSPPLPSLSQNFRLIYATYSSYIGRLSGSPIEKNYCSR